MPGAEAHRRLSVQRCKPCANRHDQADMLEYFLAALAQYVLNDFYEESPAHHVNQDDGSTLLQTLEVEKIVRYQSVPDVRSSRCCTRRT